MLAGLCQVYRGIETWSVTDKRSDDQQSSLKSSNGTVMNGSPIKALGALAEL